MDVYGDFTVVKSPPRARGWSEWVRRVYKTARVSSRKSRGGPVFVTDFGVTLEALPRSRGSKFSWARE